MLLGYDPTKDARVSKKKDQQKENSFGSNVYRPKDDVSSDNQVAAKNAIKKKQKITPLGSSERRMGLRNVAPLVGNLTRPLVRKRGFFQAEIILHWGEIIGRDLEEHTMPVRYSPPRGENAGGGTLTIRVAGPVAIEVQHRMVQIIDRVNTYFGYRAVERIKIMQGDISRPQRQEKNVFKAPEAPIRDVSQVNISQISDPGLREVLTRLGRHVSGAQVQTAKNGK